MSEVFAHDAPLLKTRRRFKTNSVENIDPLDELSWLYISRVSKNQSPALWEPFHQKDSNIGEHTGAKIKIKVSQRLPMFSLLGVVVFDAMAARVPLCVFAKPPRPNP